MPSQDNDDFRGNYFFFHHTEADTITMLDRSDMNLNTAVYAVISYIIADLDELLPRDDVIAEGALKGTSKHCDQAHFPDFANSSACACTVKVRRVRARDSCSPGAGARAERGARGGGMHGGGAPRSCRRCARVCGVG